MFRYIARFNSFNILQHCRVYKSSQASPVTAADVNKPAIEVDKETIELLEHLSLVNCDGESAVKVLTDAVNFASKIHTINTDGVEPMYTVLENFPLTLRNDEVTDGFYQNDILKNASVTEEDYFVAPPGNIPLSPKNN